jgi:hypothetical protein
VWSKSERGKEKGLLEPTMFLVLNFGSCRLVEDAGRTLEGYNTLDFSKLRFLSFSPQISPIPFNASSDHVTVPSLRHFNLIFRMSARDLSQVLSPLTTRIVSTMPSRNEQTRTFISNQIDVECSLGATPRNIARLASLGVCTREKL